MSIDYNDLRYKHEDSCLYKDSNKIIKKNSKFREDPDQPDKNLEWYYDAYCKECSNFLYSFEEGHIEMY